MPKLNLSQREIKRIVAPDSGRTDYFDTELRGLLLRVSADYRDKAGERQRGARVFYVQADVLNPVTGKCQTKKAKVGAFGELTPEEARGKARLLLQQLRAGEQIAPASIPTLAEMLEIHLADNRFKPVTGHAYRSEVPAKFASRFNLPLSEVSGIPPAVIIDRFKQIERGNGPMAAKNSFGKLQAILNYAKVKYPAAMPNNPFLRRPSATECLGLFISPTFSYDDHSKPQIFSSPRHFAK